MYIINKEISFCEEDGHLENKMTGESVVMAISTRRLFSLLIAAHGNPIERDVLCKTVWDDNGLRSSYGNLNQYISILRKQLVQAGLPDDTIITVPRVGFMFNPKIDIQACTLKPQTNISIKSHLAHRFIFSVFYYPTLTIGVFIVGMIFFIFFYERDPALVSLDKLSDYPLDCNVFALPGRMTIKKMTPLPLIADNCDKNIDYFIFKRTSNPGDTLIVSCERGIPGYFTDCHNWRDDSK